MQEILQVPMIFIEGNKINKNNIWEWTCNQIIYNTLINASDNYKEKSIIKLML